MANIDHDAILAAIRGLLESATGTLRTIPSTRFYGQLPRDLDPSEESIRAAARPLVEAELGEERPHPASPNVFGNLLLRELEVIVRVVRHLDPSHKLGDDARRDDVKALAANDADVIAQALTYPNNFSSATTGLVSGLLQYQRTDRPEIHQETEGARIVTQHRFTGVVQVAPAVT